jgi:hypothetical protein
MLEIPPPGVGFTTETEAVPALAMSEAVIAAVSCVPLTKVVSADCHSSSLWMR